MEKLDRYIEQLDKIKQTIDEYPLELAEGNNKVKLEYHIKARNERNDAVNKLIPKYNEDLDNIKAAIKARIEDLFPANESVEIERFKNDSYELHKIYKYTNIFNDAYDKSKIGKVVFDLDSMESNSLEETNQIIGYVLNKFKQSGVILKKEDFNYSVYTREYMDTYIDFMDKDNFNEVIETKFNDLFWKCPNLLTHIKLNIRCLSDKYKRELLAYVDARRTKLLNEFNLTIDTYDDKYFEFKENLEFLENTDKHNLINRFVEKEIMIDDYLLDSSTRAKNLDTYVKDRTFNELSEEEKEKYFENISTLSKAVKESINVNNFSYIIKDIKDRYEHREEHKKDLANALKDVSKLESKREGLVKKYYSKSLFGKTLSQVEKNNVLKEIEDVILELNTKYKDLDYARFETKLASSIDKGSSIYDALYFAFSYYFYLKDIIKANNKDATIDEVNKLIEEYRDFMMDRNSISRDMNLFSEIDFHDLLRNKCLLLNINIIDDDFQDLEDLLKKLEVINNIYYVSLLDITPYDIKFIVSGLAI